ncbi:hypothetical protein HX787_23215 [Pseudomonas tolaasii]|uniref:Outer membrane protein H1 n=2 Tax=Pseudomonas tolaasii TaxID=29442 RepID=A0A7Y8DSX7_PSETO|nr:hypothetical protein [Pseudomonas tolaasii]ARB26423.1 hypothetical protein B5P22_03700 [Pseudomonas tolaasii]KAB0475635.1 hypothetical protein F7R12_13895 [Pseudomonas tolaasii]MBW1248349.1 hypothetical protein [Pseudomonas tolaasii]MBW4795579.1 hypothetical protein [Pseudomonas tolaasii]MBY8943827.1 hypothetical protein [Pseudomonas tolaasii]
MTAIKKLMLALTMLSATAGVQASDGAFAAFGEKTKKSGNLIQRVSFEDAGSQPAPWGQSLGLVAPQPAYRTGYEHLTGQYNGNKLRPQDLQGRYDIPQSDS